MWGEAPKITFLIISLLRRIGVKLGKKVVEVSKADLLRLCEYSWPGNIRELINLIERSVITSKGSKLELDWQTGTAGNGHEENGHVLMEDVERAHILKILVDCNWKINGEDGAANRLGLNPSTLRSRLKKLQIERHV